MNVNKDLVLKTSVQSSRGVHRVDVMVNIYVLPNAVDYVDIDILWADLVFENKRRAINLQKITAENIRKISQAVFESYKDEIGRAHV